jgi:DNA gyrase subunit A
MATREEDAVQFLFTAGTLDTVLYFTDRGKVYAEKAYRVPDSSRAGKGIPLINLINIAPNERVTAVVVVPSTNGAGYVTMLTRRGRIKRAHIGEFTSVRPSGLIAVTLEAGDELGWVTLTHGDEDIIVVTQRGRALRFAETSVRAMGRAAGGVAAIRLAENDAVGGMDVAHPDGQLLVVTANGYAKRTPVSEYTPHGRHTQGIRAFSARALETTGPIVNVRVVSETDEIALISSDGMVLRTTVNQVSRQGRATRGTIAMRLRADDTVAAVALLTAEAGESPTECAS